MRPPAPRTVTLALAGLLAMLVLGTALAGFVTSGIAPAWTPPPRPLRARPALDALIERDDPSRPSARIVDDFYRRHPALDPAAPLPEPTRQAAGSSRL